MLPRSEEMEQMVTEYITAGATQRKRLESRFMQYRQVLKEGTCNFYQELRMMQTEAEIHYDISFSSDTVQLHSHTFYEILFCNGGNVHYLLGANRYRLRRGDLLLIPPGVSHRPLFMEQLVEPYERFALWLDAGFFERTVQQYEDLAFAQCEKRGSYLLRTSQPSWEGLHAGFRSLWQETQSKRLGWQLCVSSGALGLMAHISRTYYYLEATTAPAEHDSLADEVFRFIDAHLAEKITLECVANHFFVSKSTVSHLFREQMGVSFYRCVIQRRLIAAKNHICHGMPLHTVWETCGFADYSSFYRLFKKEYQVSPPTIQGALHHAQSRVNNPRRGKMPAARVSFRLNFGWFFIRRPLFVPPLGDGIGFQQLQAAKYSAQHKNGHVIDQIPLPGFPQK